MTTLKEIAEMSDGKLELKSKQHWDMAGLARQDKDYRDMDRHTDIARTIDNEIRRRQVEARMVK